MQTALVDLIVLVAALYATWRLLPSAVRRRAAAVIARTLRRHGVDEVRVASIERHAAASACGACDSCGGCAPRAPPPETRAAPIALRRTR